MPSLSTILGIGGCCSHISALSEGEKELWHPNATPLSHMNTKAQEVARYTHRLVLTPADGFKRLLKFVMELALAYRKMLEPAATNGMLS